MTEDIIFKVAKRRIREIELEVPHPDLATHFSVDEEGRGCIDLFFQDKLIGQEFIETQESWEKERRIFDYRRVLQKRVRLVVMAPRKDAMKVRMRMLELNNWWLCNYMVYGYDERGRLVRVLRPVPHKREGPECV